MIKEISKLKYVYDILPEDIAAAVRKIPQGKAVSADEVRMRNCRPLSITLRGENFFLTHNGGLEKKSENGIKITPAHIKYVYLKAFKNSLHSFGKDIIKGSVTVQGGNRVGFCGTAVCDSRCNYTVENIKNISSLNIRIAREVVGCSEDFYLRYLENKPLGILVCGIPSCGKTTFLRDLTRLMGNSHRVSLIDEGGEFAAQTDGIPANDVGELTDVFSGYNKYEGIMTAVKSMSPEYLVCDEIGGIKDLSALEYCLNSGVKLCASCHAGSIDEALKRPTIGKLMEKNAFGIVVLLDSGKNTGKPCDIRIIKND